MPPWCNLQESAIVFVLGHKFIRKKHNFIFKFQRVNYEFNIKYVPKKQ